MTHGAVRALLRLEGLAWLAGAAYFYHQSGVGWVLFAALFLAPDLSLLGYLAGPTAGAAAYNAAHTFVLPLMLGAALPQLLPYACIWIAHIGFDRCLGYGLKYPESFGATHLGAIGRRRTSERAA